MGTAAFKALRDLFRPQIVVLLFGIPLLALSFWALVGYLAFPFIGHLFQDFLIFLKVDQLFGQMMGGGWADEAAMGFMILVLLLLMLPMVYWTSLLMMSFLALPVILRILKPLYPRSFESKKSPGIFHSLVYLVRVFGMALLLYGCLVLLLWVPSVYAVGTFVLGAWVNAQFLSLEILNEFVDSQNLKALLREHRKSILIMGALLMLLLGVPFVQLVTPIFGGLWFTHWWLQLLENKNLSATDARI